MYLHKPEEYKKKVAGESQTKHTHIAHLLIPPQFSDYVKRFATEEALRETEKDEQSSDESSMSDFSEDETKDMEL
jgi:ubiquitin-conjugating enzyme E2 H